MAPDTRERKNPKKSKPRPKPWRPGNHPYQWTGPVKTEGFHLVPGRIIRAGKFPDQLLKEIRANKKLLKYLKPLGA